MKHIITLVLTTLLASGCAGGPQRKAGDESIAYLDYAGEPIRGFTSYNLQSWQPLSRNQLVLWTGVNQAYLVTIWDGCQDLMFTQAIHVSSTGSQITNFDHVNVGRDRCQISQIRPIDVRQMKADRAADRATAKSN